MTHVKWSQLEICLTDSHIQRTRLLFGCCKAKRVASQLGGDIKPQRQPRPYVQCRKAHSRQQTYSRLWVMHSEFTSVFVHTNVSNANANRFSASILCFPERCDFSTILTHHMNSYRSTSFKPPHRHSPRLAPHRHSPRLATMDGLRSIGALRSGH